MPATLMVKHTIAIINKLGLHARAAAKFVSTASRYESDVRVACDERQVNETFVLTWVRQLPVELLTSRRIRLY